nr:MAG TPA: hypothetical protein [Caudoviricetes sp.]
MRKARLNARQFETIYFQFFTLLTFFTSRNKALLSAA